jgi:hypothetical protein
MADAAEDAAGMTTGTVRLKWPNDLVIVVAGPGASLAAEPGADAARERLAAPLEIRKLAGILGETEGLGTGDPRAVVGIGVNADWRRRLPPDLVDDDEPPGASGGRRWPRAPPRRLHRTPRGQVEALGGYFDVPGGSPPTTGREVRLVLPDGTEETVRAVAADPVSGALVVADAAAAGGERQVLSAEVVHARLPVGSGV